MQMSTAVTCSRLGHHPPVWRTHQDIAHPCGEHTRTSPTRVENTPGEWARVTIGHLSVCQLWCLFLAHAFVWLSCRVKSFNIASLCQLRCLFLARAFAWLFYCHVKLLNIASSCQVKQKYVVKNTHTCFLDRCLLLSVRINVHNWFKCFGI